MDYITKNQKDASKFTLPGVSLRQTRQLLPDDLILLVYRGSIAHDVYVPQSDPNSIDDKDIMGTFIGPDEFYLGFAHSEYKGVFIGEWDAVSYELRKLMNLLIKSNPNVLSMLWVDEKHVLFQDDFGKKLRQNRDIFSAKTIYQSFTGYAYSQLKRMTHFQFEGYMGEKRKKLVEHFGYDTKNAAHLIRLLRMGIEFLREGVLHVTRPDAQELLAIKKGDWTLERVKTQAERLFKEAEEEFVNSKLPDVVDEKYVEKFLVDMIKKYRGY